MDLDRISLIANINFLLSYFRGCWLLEFFSVLEIGGQKMKQLLRLSWRWHCMAVSFVMKLKLLAKETLQNLARFPLAYILIINTTVCWTSLFSKDLKSVRHQYKLDPVNAMFLTVCAEAYFWKTAESTFPFHSRTAYSTSYGGIVYQ